MVLSIQHSVIALLSLLVVVGVVFYVKKSAPRYGKILWSTALLTWVLIMLGAYVRLSDAGLGCPDWPGCYGHFTPAQAIEPIRAQELVNPAGPVSLPKAWKEMVHRYWAGVVGSLILGIIVLAWKNRHFWQISPWLATGVGGLVFLQALLGAWTVTMLLKPAIVTGHLLGGMLLFASLSVLAVRQSFWGKSAIVEALQSLRPLLMWATIAVFLQIILGGWVSTNYAALACSDFPLCQGQWLPSMDFQHGFHIFRELGMRPDGELLSLENLTAIHWVHRLSALLVFLVVGALSIVLIRGVGNSADGEVFAVRRFLGLVLGVLLLVQIGLGITNIWGGLPLWAAIAHNGVAALLLGVLSMLTYLSCCYPVSLR